MKRLLVILTAMTLSFSAFARGGEGRLRQLLISEFDEREIDAIIEFCERETPDFLREVEGSLPEDITMEDIEDGNVTEDVGQVVEAVERMIDFHEEYRDVAREAPKHAELMLKIGKAEAGCWLLGRRIVKLRKEDASRSGDKVTALEGDLKKKLNALFDLKQDAQKREIEWMQEEMEELKALIEKRERSRKKVIDLKFMELTGEDDILYF